VTELVRSPFTLIDGGLSTSLEEMGERPAGLLWTAAMLLDRPEVLTAAHRRYVEAGADVVITASYQASEPGFVAAGLSPADARRVLATTTEVARAAGASMVAASVGPFGAYLANGSEYTGNYDTPWADIRAFHRARLEVLADTGPDLFAIETIPLAAEAEIIVEELRAITDAPAWVTFSCIDESHTCGGDVFAEAALRVRDAVHAVGVNCSAPGTVAPLLRSAASAGVRTPFVTYPNHGATWDAEHKCWIGPTGGAELPGHVPEWLEAGARLIGGCCGVGVEGIRALNALRISLT